MSIIEQRSKSTGWNQVFKNIEAKIKGVFNRDFFGFYYGIVENVDTENGLLTVRIPFLNNSLYEDCKIMLPCSTDTSVMYPNFKINTSVIVGFCAFNLGNPIVLGSTLGSSLSIPMESDTVSISNGTCKVSINNNTITLTNGISSLILNDAGISLTGPVLTANGENLSDDDIGEI